MPVCSQPLQHERWPGLSPTPPAGAAICSFENLVWPLAWRLVVTRGIRRRISESSTDVALIGTAIRSSTRTFIRWRQEEERVAVEFEARILELAYVATCGYIRIMETGIRELKDNLSRYIRRIEAGERISVTAHGRVVAELVPPASGPRTAQRSRFDELVATGVIRPPVEAGNPLEDWPDIRLPRGTAADLIDSDRGEA